MEALRLVRALGFAALGVFLLGAVLRADGAELYRAATYFETTGQVVTVEWNAVTHATKYVWRIKSVERQKYIIIDGAAEHETTATSFDFAVPFMGHFVVEVKAMDDEGNASIWAKSDDAEHARVEGEKAGWWVYGVIAPAGDLDITQGGNDQ